jgi:hypothetical protein
MTMNNSITCDINNPIEKGKLFGTVPGASATQKMQSYWAFSGGIDTSNEFHFE